MKTLKKRITVGDYSFEIGTNRDIAVRAMEEYPDFALYVFSQQGAELVFEDALKNKQLSKYFEILKQEKDIILYAFPLMYEEANGKKLDFEKEFYAFLEDNNAMDVFVSKVFEFLMLGFTQKENKPKVKLELK